MSHSPTVWPLPAGLSGTTGSGTRGLFPPLYPPPGHHGQPSPAASPGCPWLPPGALVLTPLSPLREHRTPPQRLTNVLPKRPRLP
jgi:hypothetical protein